MTSHLIDFNDIGLGDWSRLYSRISEIIDNPRGHLDAMRGKVAATLFFEPSTRTQFSFQAAVERLGGSVIGFSNPMTSSVAKGESLEDTIRMVAGYSDIIVMRTPTEGAPLLASTVSRVPVINAGDGSHMHPTQTLTDLTAIMRLRGTLKGLRIGMCGDLKNGRTVHSLARAMARYEGTTFVFCSTENLHMPADITEMLREAGVAYETVRTLEECIGSLDVLYMTRIQKERFSNEAEYEAEKGVYVLDRRKLDMAGKDLLVLHPLPRIDEIAPDIDDDPRCVYFEQARLGMYARMGLLEMMLSGELMITPEKSEETGRICKNPHCVTASGSAKRLSRTGSGIEKCAYCDWELR